MIRSVKWRLVIIGIVIAFALFNLYPTLKWASLSESRKRELVALWDKEARELREDLDWDRLSPQEKLADIQDWVTPLREAYEDKKLDEKFWQRVNGGDLTGLSEEEKEEFLSLCEKLTGKKPTSDASPAQLREHLASLREVRKKLDKDFWSWVQRPKWATLGKKEREKFRGIILQLTGRRIPRTPTVARNIINWFRRWWEGDESQIISLGLDLRGGSYFILEVEKPRGMSSAEAVEGATRVLTDRIDKTGVREPVIQRQAVNKIIVQLPGATDVERQKRLIQRQVLMRWLLVDENRVKLPQFSEKRLLDLYDQAEAELKEEFKDRKDERGNPVEWTWSDLDLKLGASLPPDTVLRVWEHQERHASGRRVKMMTPLLLRSSEEQPEVIKGSEIIRAEAGRDPETAEPIINFTLNNEGARKFADVTREYNAQSKNSISTPRGSRGWRLAILLDEEVISAPAIQSEIFASGKIEGNFTPEEARDLAIQLKAGALPAKLNIVAENTVGPTLGADSIRKGVTAALLALALIVVFMCAYYLLAGLIANFALALNIVIILGVLASLRATLTLPGIAGIILTIGMAVDANVLIFERIREELAAAKKIAAAIDSGYQKAFVTILDSNLTTFICAIVLYYVGTGPVRGFAVTLAIGLATSMFTAIVVTRVIFDLMLRSKRFQGLRMLSILRKPKLDFVRQMKKAVIGSIVVILLGMVCFGVKWSGNFGIDFSSGTSATLVFEKEITRDSLAKIRKALRSSKDIEDFNLRRFRLGGETADTGVAVDAKMTEGRNSPSLADRVAAALPGNPVVSKSQETIHPTVAHRLWKQATIAVLVSLVAMLVYIAWRFEFRFALGGIIALFHDVMVTLGAMTGFFILTQRQLNLPVVAAVLTIIGYSINDTIVIFDRVREDMKIMKGVDLRTIINTAVNQTLSRTLLTSLTTLLAVLSLFIFGGQAINDFAFAMLVGCVVGVYSTVFIASPIVLLLEKTR